ncbi:unnamed protein product, partial [marine sediment metagenome]
DRNFFGSGTFGNFFNKLILRIKKCNGGSGGGGVA